MKRILIIGACGAGKSTLSRKLSEKLGIPAVHLDRIWWRANWTNPTREEFDAELEQLLLKETQWVMDGNYGRSLPRRLEFADTVILLRSNRFRSLWYVLIRLVKYYGKNRPDLGEGCPERLDWEFLRYVWNFNRDELPKVEEVLAAYLGVCHQVELRSHREIDEFVAGICVDGDLTGIGNCNCICEQLEPVESFSSLESFKRFARYMDSLAVSGELIPIDDDEEYRRKFRMTYQGTWFRCAKCGQTWRLVEPDFPCRGAFEKIDKLKKAGRNEPIKY